MLSTSHILQRSSSLLATLVASCWLVTHQGRAQTLETSFGVIRSFALSGDFERLSSLSFSPSQSNAVLLWSPKNPVVALASFDTLGNLSLRNYTLTTTFDDVRVIDLHGTKQPALLLLDRSKRSISFVSSVGGDTLVVASSLALPFEPDGVVIGDLNNDRREDILLYARNTPGIIPYLNRGKGQFAPAPTIAPDNPVSTLTLTHLNDDNVLDIVMYDWVKSEIHFLYGVGRARFFDQTVIPINGELKEMLFVDMNGDLLSDLVLWLSKPSSVQWREGNGLGDFVQRNTVEMVEPVKMGVADLNGDGWRDFLFLTKKPSLQTILVGGDEPLTDQIEHAVGVARDVLVSDLNGDGLKDALLVAPKQKLLLALMNAQTSVSLNDSLDYATGLQPVGCLIADVNGDRRNDILVLNSESSSMSVYLGRERGLVGQLSYALPPKPSTISLHSLRDSSARLAVSHSATRSLTFVTVDFRDHTSTTATIPDVGQLEVISEPTRDVGPVQFYCFTPPQPAEGPSLNVFQQLGSRTFIEQSFRLTIPDALLGAVATDITGDGFTDVAYVYRNAESGGFELATSLGDSASAFTPKVFQLELKETALQKSFLWSADFNNDGKRDLLLAFPQVAKMLKVALGNGDGTFQEPETIFQNVRLTNRQQLFLTDVDRDGTMDIVLNNADEQHICWLRGIGDGTFESFVPLVSSVGVSHFAVGDVNGDGMNDLVVTLQDEGILRIYNGTLVFKNVVKASY